jgi:hypothetical protein
MNLKFLVAFPNLMRLEIKKSIPIMMRMEYQTTTINAPMNQVHQTIVVVLIKSTAVVVGRNGMNKTSVNIPKYLVKTVEKNYCFVNEMMGCMGSPTVMFTMKLAIAPIVGMKNKFNQRYE